MSINYLLKFAEILKCYLNKTNPARFVVTKDNKSYFMYDNQICKYYYPKSMGSVKYVCFANENIDDSHNEKLRLISNDVRLVMVINSNALSKEQIDIISNMKNLEAVYLMKPCEKYFYRTKPEWIDDCFDERVAFDLPEFTNVITKLL
jgi:hypothetical protein